jgi:hypothetical protein
VFVREAVACLPAARRAARDLRAWRESTAPTLVTTPRCRRGSGRGGQGGQPRREREEYGEQFAASRGSRMAPAAWRLLALVAQELAELVPQRFSALGGVAAVPLAPSRRGRGAGRCAPAGKTESRVVLAGLRS